MKKNIDFEKEQYRGTIKQLMKVYGFRTISLSNYYKWKGITPDNLSNVATLKYNLQDGYLNMFDHHNNKLDNETAANLYKDVYNTITEIFKNSDFIPYKKRRNILVKINR